MKKPAQLGDNLLNIRPRKGEAKPQTEVEAFEATEPVTPVPSAPKTTQPRRRRRLSDKKLQLNLRVSEKSLQRFTALADEEGLIFGDLFERMLDRYEKK